MNEREKYIIRAALIYMQSNLLDVNAAFEDSWGGGEVISVNGDEGSPIAEGEVEELLKAFQ